jgi:SAM-dependent methyltransferase
MSLEQDLEDFLSFPPEALVRALRQPARPSPTSASAEPTAHARWQLDSLVQDVWEHSAGPEAKVQQQVINALASFGRKDVYDLGSGAGYYAFALAERGARVMCVERSRVKRMFLRFRIERHGLKERILLRRFTRAFDAALAINVLDHMRRPHGAIKALASRVALNGALAIWAAFPEDGWHTSIANNRRQVRRSLLKYFEPRPTLAPAPHDLITLTRRRRKSGKVWLDPEMNIKAHPQRPGHVVLFAPRAYSDALVATEDMRDFVTLCRSGGSLRRIRRATERAGFNWKQARHAISMMCDAGLAIVGRKLLEVQS